MFYSIKIKVLLIVLVSSQMLIAKPVRVDEILTDKNELQTNISISYLNVQKTVVTLDWLVIKRQTVIL
jgi:hypothetical protein